MASTTITTTPSRKRKPSSARRLFTGKKARVSARPTTLVNKSLTPYPARFVTRLKYVYNNIVAGAVAGVAVDTRFNLNSLYSPEFSGGHQPYGFDQLCAANGSITPYGRYRVMATTWRVTFLSTQNLFTVVIPNNSTSSLTGAVENTAELPRAVSKLAGTASGASVITGGIRLANLNGDTESRYKADDRFQAPYNAKPLEDLLLHVVGRNPDASAATAAYGLEVVLQFHCEFFDPNTMVSS